MAESLRQKQSRFARMTAQLINHATILGYDITLGHALRSREEAKRLGFSKSLHCEKLALDLNLFKNGRFLTSTKSHEPLGLYWESIGGTWGGRFNDGNHYSLEHRGIK